MVAIYHYTKYTFINGPFKTTTSQKAGKFSFKQRKLAHGVHQLILIKTDFICTDNG